MKQFIFKLTLFCFLFYFSCYFAIKYLNIDIGLNNELEYKVQQLIKSTKKCKTIVFAGDSRAERQLIPRLISRKMGVKCINLGVSSGELISFIPYLKLFNPDSTFFVFSVSSFQINDKVVKPGYLSLDAYNSFNFFERCYLYQSNIVELLKMEQQLFKYTFNRIVRHGQNCYLPNKKKKRMILDLGYLKRGGVLKRNHLLYLYKKNKHIWYTEVYANGVKLKLFKNAINEIQKQGFVSLVFQPPVCPTWKKIIAHSKIDTSEKYFSNILSKFSTKKKNVYFIDFYTHPFVGLTDTMFCDAQHLNAQGAIKFSNLMVDSIKRYYQ